MSAYKVYSKKHNKTIEEIVDNKENTIIDDTNSDSTISNTRVYKSLDSSIDVINYLYASLDNRITDVYKKEVNISEVEDTYKVYNILYYLYNERQYDSITEEEYNRLFPGLYIEEIKNYYGSITYDDANTLYKRIYNKDIETGIDYSIEGYCPSFKFDNNKYYFGIQDCKNDNVKLVNYNYKYVVTDESADVYVSLGVLENNTNFKVYKYDQYSGIVFQESETDILFNIDQNNYNEYTKYIVHFINTNGEYYISSIRKVAE